MRRRGGPGAEGWRRVDEHHSASFSRKAPSSRTAPGARNSRPAALPLGEFPDLWNLTHPERCGGPARLRGCRQPGHPHQHLRRQPHPAGRTRWPPDPAEINAPASRSRGRRSRPGASFRLDRPQRQTAHERRCHAGANCCAAFAEQASALAGAGADALVVETMADLEKRGWRVRPPAKPGCRSWPAWSSTAARTRPHHDGQHARAGRRKPSPRPGRMSSAPTAVRALRDIVPICQPHACGNRPADLDQGQCRAPRNGERPHHLQKRRPRNSSRHSCPCSDAGADFVGGCCGTTPDFIRAVAEKVRAIGGTARGLTCNAGGPAGRTAGVASKTARSTRRFQLVAAISPRDEQGHLERLLVIEPRIDLDAVGRGRGPPR